jgi:CBS-domain-containing membrane protein
LLSLLSHQFPDRFSTFYSLYEQVRVARNDAMHTGAYARHATSAAIELCIGLEEAIMKEQQMPREQVKDFMVKQVISIEPWQPVAHARHLMLTHSFTFVPVFTNSWKLVSETSMAKYLRGQENWSARLAMPISEAEANGLTLLDAKIVDALDSVQTLIQAIDPIREPHTLWLIADGHGKLAGVLSPFELM